MMRLKSARMRASLHFARRYPVIGEHENGRGGMGGRVMASGGWEKIVHS